MITPRYLRFLSVYLRFTSAIFHAIPFQVDKLDSDFTLHMQNDPKSIVLFYINFTFQSEAMSWSFFRLCQMHLTGDYHNIHHYVIHCFNLVGFGYPVILQIFLMEFGQSLCDYFNQSLSLDKMLREKYLKRKQGPKLDLLETGAACIIPFVYLQGICFGFYSLVKPTKPFFHCSLLMDLGWSGLAQIPVKIYECYMIINCWHVIVSSWLVLCTAVYANVRWSSEIIQKRKNYETIDNLRVPINSLAVYKPLFMLCEKFNHLSRVWMSGLALYFGKFVGIYMAFASIKLAIKQTLPFKEYLAYPTSCLFLFLVLGFFSHVAEKWHIHSSLYITQLRWHRRPLIRRSARALLPMAAQILYFMKIERGFGVETAQDAAVEIGDLVISTQ